jgi:hypothetical protein
MENVTFQGSIFSKRQPFQENDNQLRNGVRSTLSLATKGTQELFSKKDNHFSMES